MKYNLLLMLMLAFGLSQGCLDPIDLAVPAKERETLVIQAKLSKGEPSVVEAVVNRLFDFTASSRIPVVVRSVELIDEDGTVVTLEANSATTYIAVIDESSPMVIDYGRSYRLKVATFDGRLVESDMEVLLPTPVPDKLTFTTGTVLNDSTLVDEDIVQVYVSTDLRANPGSPTKSRMRWELEVTYEADDAPIVPDVEPKTCWISQTPELDQIKTVDGEELSDERIDDFLVGEVTVGPNFAKGVYINVYQESLTASALTYWEQVGELVQRSGNMFEAPVGKLATNFRNVNEGVADEIFGYFYATDQQVVRVFVDPSDVGNPTPLCPWTGMVAPGRGCTIPQLCCDCSMVPNSTTVKPEYWVR